MNTLEATEVEEQLLLIYRFLEEDRLFKKFYGTGLATKNDNQILNRLLAEEDAEDILRNCIMELEEIQTGSKPSREEFEEMIVNYDPSDSYRKYSMKGLGDIYKLDLEQLIRLL
ncbi:MAG TPA: hypothetical protein VK444_03855 [Methanobacteriaceae archaeon]|nr:hypothetical protein [Methanobacteriaceae archaeon]